MTTPTTTPPAAAVTPSPPAPPHPSRPRKPVRPGRVLTHLALASYCLTSVSAFVWCVMVSLKTNPEFFSTSPWSLPSDPQFGNYAEAWSSAQISRFFVNSLYVTVASVGISLLFSVMAAYVLARVDFPGRTAVRMVFLSGLMMPAFLVIVPLYFLLRNLGLLGSLHGLILVYIATQIPFSIYLLQSFFQSLPKELEEAACVDGASPTRTFFSVVLPQVSPAVASVALLNTLTIWNEFFFALVFLTDPQQQTIPVGVLGLSVNAQYSANWVQLFAGLVITMIPMLVLFAFAQERIARGVSVGALKG
ncbi:carbohydrate ABC transporter permease [Jiangella mangrovi]|uniref:Raffinose/stachyose/melibiose transport system permease protein/N-acetylglucosamine transport system permease protein n=1 Tax=Jiangella mangrovi TaxID=1524084 RepID=A0A7W9GW76_9ACTN|nr:carbohydrate ABC transporter permease [Jiangella mangrovi]MBB5791190.1 raffinose/stachyose/melibiose transport system permease protein/N-acetylglucosamine transport system permease protein [Jiangella mangrovi]